MKEKERMGKEEIKMRLKGKERCERRRETENERRAGGGGSGGGRADRDRGKGNVPLVSKKLSLKISPRQSFVNRARGNIKVCSRPASAQRKGWISQTKKHRHTG